MIGCNSYLLHKKKQKGLNNGENMLIFGHDYITESASIQQSENFTTLFMSVLSNNTHFGNGLDCSQQI